MSKILIVVDAQNDFINGVLGNPANEAIAENIAKYISYVREYGFTIITTRDDHGADYHETKEGKAFPPHCLKYTPGHQLYPAIKDVVDPDKDYEVDKRTFGSLGLVGLLKDIDTIGEPIEEIQICGFATDICVLANTILAASAFPNTRIIVLKNLCGATTPANHSRAIALMRGMLIDVMESNCAACAERDMCSCACKDGCAHEISQITE